MTTYICLSCSMLMARDMVYIEACAQKHHARAISLAEDHRILRMPAEAHAHLDVEHMAGNKVYG